MDKWFKEKWTSVVGWILVIGITYGGYVVTSHWTDDRIKRIEDVNPAQLRWQVERNVMELDKSTSELKTLQGQLSDVKAQIGVINSKLDTIIETLKKGQH